jgi:hypothetical protein
MFVENAHPSLKHISDCFLYCKWKFVCSIQEMLQLKVYVRVSVRAYTPRQEELKQSLGTPATLTSSGHYRAQLPLTEPEMDSKEFPLFQFVSGDSRSLVTSIDHLL